MDEANLAEKILSFLLDAILDDVDEPYAETLEAAFNTWPSSVWNNTVQEKLYEDRKTPASCN